MQNVVKLLSSVFLILLSCSVHATKSIILLGSPGSGKGTQAERIAQEYNLPVLCFGTLFRAEELQKSELYKKKIAADSNSVLRNELRLAVFSERVQQGFYAHGLILDSWPKDKATLITLKEHFFKDDPPLVIELVTPLAIALERGLARIVCPNADCGISYGATRKPLIEGRCDNCKKPLCKREHDNKRDFPERLKRYCANHSAIMSVYEEQGIKVHQVSSDQDPDLVFRAIQQHIASYLGR